MEENKMPNGWACERLGLTFKEFTHLKAILYFERQKGICVHCKKKLHPLGHPQNELHHLDGIKNNSPMWCQLLHDECHAEVDPYRARFFVKKINRKDQIAEWREDGFDEEQIEDLLRKATNLID